jgi:hypothetical protein
LSHSFQQQPPRPTADRKEGHLCIEAL